jgi:hypothetical protein
VRRTDQDPISSQVDWKQFFATIVVTSTVRIEGLVAEYRFTLKWKSTLMLYKNFSLQRAELKWFLVGNKKFLAIIVVSSSVRIEGLVAEYPLTLKWKTAL